jgi:hypothetical protein
MSVTEELQQFDVEYQRRVDARRSIDVEQRRAREAVAEAGAALEQLTAKKMAGEGDEPPAKALADAQRALDKAREAAGQEWGIQRAAGDRLVRDADRQRHAFIIENAEALLAEEYERGEAVASVLNAAAEQVLQAHRDWAESETRVMRVVHAAHPGDERRVTHSRANEVRRACEQMLGQGGEQPPRFEPARVVAIGEELPL